MKKILVLILGIALVLPIAIALVGCNRNTDKYPIAADDKVEKKELLVLGDSIAEALVGPAPVNERDSYGAYGILSDINNMRGHNRSISGHRTYQLLNLINEGDVDATLFGTHLKNADVITISILANELLRLNTRDLLIEHTRNGMSQSAIDALAESAVIFKESIQKIKQQNSKATIIVQTLYNPAFPDPERTMFFDHEIEYLIEQGVNVKNIRKDISIYIKMLNKIITDYIDEEISNGKEAPYHVADVYKAFDEIYEKDHEIGIGLMSFDGLHPSNEGQAVIAGAYQTKLEELGLASKEIALMRYKNLRVSQLFRIFPGKVNAPVLTEKIINAKSYTEVTEIFFNATRKLSAVPRVVIDESTHQHKAKYVSEKTELPITGFSVANFPSDILKMVIDPKSSSIVFDTDGIMTATVMLPEYAIAAVNVLLESQNNLSKLEVMPGINIGKFLEMYGPILSGFDKNNLGEGLDLFNKYLGLEFIGFDFSKEPFKGIAESIAKDGNLPDKILIPTTEEIDYVDENGDTIKKTVKCKYGLKFTARYEIVKLKGADGKIWNAIYLGKTDKNVDPFVIMDTKLDANGNPTEATINIKFLPLMIKGEIKLESSN